MAGAGILTFVIGFAFKDISENFLAGILLAFKSPFKADDLIETENVIGYVKELRIRETIIKTTEGVLLGAKKPTVVIDEFATSTINLKVYFWLDTFKSASKSCHLGIRTQVMKNALLTLTDNGFSLPSSIVEIKQYEG